MMRVLVVEDDARLARLLERALSEEGHRVGVANDGAAGLEAARGALDAIVLDVMLPKLDGIEMCRRLREDGVATPILLLTARDHVSDRVRGLDAGADDYLVKPFALEELHARLRALARRTGGKVEGPLRIADLSLDPSRHEVHRGDREIALTPTEFRLLEFLLRHRGRVVTKDQILEHVWGYDTEVVANIIELYIHYLRAKIDRGAQRPLIRTVRGVGYAVRE